MARNPIIRVLGPIDVVTPSGAPSSAGGRRQRALLAALVVGAGRAVPIDHLCEVLWGDRPPRSADNTLGSYVSNLRQVVGAHALVRRNHSYEIDLDTVDVDALEFERFIRRAEAAGDRPRACWQLCSDALGLWRGRPFGDLADDEPFALEAFRLDELRLLAMELSMGADLALGRHDLVVAELETAVREHPFRERLWLLLMDALALCGRRVEALRAGAELRRVLGEVGIEVDDEVVELERRILQGDAGPPR